MTRQFKTRWTLLLTFCGSFFLVIWARLFDIQILRGESFLKLADNNRYYALELPAERGVFLDRYGQSLVFNERLYYRSDNPDALHPHRETIDKSSALRLMASDSSSLEYGISRIYKYPEALSQVIGYVGLPSAEDLQQDKNLGLSDFVGKSGLESHFDQKLRGTAGRKTYEINALGQKQKLVEEVGGDAGANLETSLDPYLSQVSYQALGEKSGAVVILDARTGKILSLVSSPSFDANVMSSDPSDQVEKDRRRSTISNYFSDPRQVFFNRAISGSYPPGSVFKLVTALAGLESEAFNLSTEVVDEGTLKVGDFEYANWFFTQYGRTEGPISLIRALSRSNDIFFYKAAEWVGPEALANFSKLLGLGRMTGVELGGESAGLIPDPAWKEKVIGEPWYLGNTYHFGIGQGDVAVTPLQIAALTQTIANDGLECLPRLMMNDDQQCSELSLQEEHLDAVLLGMLDACSSGGTAFPFFPHNSLIRDESSPESQIDRGAVACKTGTAEFGGVDAQGYRKTHAWLTAIVGTGAVKELSSSDNVEIEGDPDQATDSAALAVQADLKELHKSWLKNVKAQGFPDRIVVVALVESNEENEFMEGSRDAGPVVLEVLKWMGVVE